MNKLLKYRNSEYSLRISSYVDNDRIAIAMYENWDGHHESAGPATRNLEEYLFGHNEAFMDEVNLPGITNAFVAAGLAKPLNREVESDGDKYPVVELILDEIKKYDHIPDDNEEWDDIEREDADDSEDIDALFAMFAEKEDL
jgi:hypothetical protein